MTQATPPDSQSKHQAPQVLFAPGVCHVSGHAHPRDILISGVFVQIEHFYCQWLLTWKTHHSNLALLPHIMRKREEE